HAGLAAVADGAVRQALTGLGDADISQSLAELAPPAAVSGGTVDYVPEPGQRYTLTRLHATGGIGRVWLAHDSDLGREVALKELRPERAENPRFSARFLHEAQITGQLEHPGIVPVYELTQRAEDRQPFYTMRFIKGRTLTDAIRAYHAKRPAGPSRWRRSPCSTPSWRRATPWPTPPPEGRPTATRRARRGACGVPGG